MKRLADWALAAADSGKPVLGVCFGHQLLGWALGATVEQNPKGRERGTCFVDLTDEGVADPLFQDLPRRFEVQQTHGDHLARAADAAPFDSRDPDHTPWQSFRYRNITGVQFHPRSIASCSRRSRSARARKPTCGTRPLQERVLANWARTLR
jgi:GMP synthase (glutamine-hydrolysing)